MSAAGNRVLTIRIECQDSESTKWLWDCHLKHEFTNGVRVTAFHNGDLFKEKDQLEAEVSDLEDEVSDLEKGVPFQEHERDLAELKAKISRLENHVIATDRENEQLKIELAKLRAGAA